MARSNPALDIIERLNSTAAHLRTPCGEGQMRWRSWGSGTPLVLLHGGYGSWLHWIHNIEPLSQRFRVIAGDLPGLGESSVPPDADSPSATAALLGGIIADGLREILGDEPFDLAGFSFGGLTGGQAVKILGEQVKTFTMVGASGMKLTRPAMELMRRTDDMSDADREAAYVHNAMTLMLHDRASLDALGLHIHKTNDANARFRSRRISLGDSLLLALPQIKARIAGIWGEFDATAVGYMHERPELLRSIQPDAAFTLIEGAGHWVQFEKSEAFNSALIETIDRLAD
ncbi:MAG: 2-hydroxy-6-oxonona-2,4-dienedioate hydrolase [Gammaproteobacteria bacterium]|jgi:2-hydroxy-6-oxonona-2,4-dienedioate hydrolase